MIRRSMVENITVFLGFRAVTFISHGMSSLFGRSTISNFLINRKSQRRFQCTFPIFHSSKEDDTIF